MNTIYNKVPKKILVVNPLNIGDIVLTGPMIRVLKKQYPNCSIDFLVTPRTEKIAQCIPYIDNVILYDKANKHRRIKDLMKLRKELHMMKYDLAITIHISTRSAITTWLSGAPCRIGLNAQGSQIFLTHGISEKTLHGHRSEQMIQLLKPLGIEESQNSKLDLQINPIILEHMKEKLELNFNRPIVIICPFGNWPQKIWTTENYSELLIKLSDIAQLFLIGGQADRTGLETINAGAGGVATVLAGELDLSEMAALIKLATLLVTIDTGPLHIADALGTPLVALFGPTEPECWGPRGKNTIVITHKMDCKPCLNRTLCKDNQCMKQITVKEVFEQTQILLNKLKSKSIS